MLRLPNLPWLKNLSRKNYIIIGTVLLLLIVIIAILAIISLNQNDSSDAQINKQNGSSGFQNITNNNGSSDTGEGTFFYGSLSGNKSIIKTVDLITNKTTLIATLPQNIKKVNNTNPNQLIYINQTDIRDHGKNITGFNIQEKKAVSLIQADENFGIDDYILSPNKRYMAIWEVAFAKDADVLRGGRSRVYGIDLQNPSKKYLLFDEAATQPIHYPQAVTDEGYVFADLFMPNDPNGGAGWAYGMSVVRYDNSERQNLSNMKAGTYGTQPFPAPNAKYLAFAGYDGSRGDGTSNQRGFRQALLTPNTIEILNTQTLKREELEGFTNEDIYSGVDWGGNDSLIITLLSKEKNKSGIYSYNLNDKTLSKINLPKNGDKSFSYITQTNNKGLLMGTIDDSLSGVGNLGDSYIPSLTGVYFQPYGSSAAKLVYLEDALVQFIGILPTNYFEKVLGITSSFNLVPTLILSSPNSNIEGYNSLQLRTFLLTRDLTTIRRQQQSYPIPTLTPTFEPTPTTAPTSTPTPTPSPTPTTTRPSPTTIIQAIEDESPTATPTSTPTPSPTQFVLPTRRPTSTPSPTISFTRPSPTPKPIFVEDCTELAKMQCAALELTEDTDEWDDCVDTNKEQNRATRGTPNAVCSRSPLYLYGAENQNVEVKIYTSVYNDFPAYKKKYNITLSTGGLMQINNNLYQSIKYDYIPNLRIIRIPLRGTIAKKSEVKKTLKLYAQKLSLNNKETADLINTGETKINSPYVFISFFDQETSENILPLSFVPKPDNYLNVVFYFKQLSEKPNYTPLPPIFPAVLKRTGFTAVEVSEIVE